MLNQIGKESGKAMRSDLVRGDHSSRASERRNMKNMPDPRRLCRTRFFPPPSTSSRSITDKMPRSTIVAILNQCFSPTIPNT